MYPFSKNTKLERILQFVKQLLFAPRWFALFIPFVDERPCLFHGQAEFDREHTRDAERPVMPTLAISNHRLLKMEDDKVFFHYKDYADDDAQKVMSLDAVEFIRRFLQHVVPTGFMRIRHFGFLANRFRAEKLARCRQLIQDADQPPATPAPSRACEPPTMAEMPVERHRCPHCGNGRMIIVERFERGSSPTIGCAEPIRVDNTS